ncbi:hypothetical protein ANO11243_092800 [Dothideomycetidae sp. 11243]|nr:hypothetical protein ANO11243_092800 [fungal sp. No.11243]
METYMESSSVDDRGRGSCVTRQRVRLRCLSCFEGLGRYGLPVEGLASLFDTEVFSGLRELRLKLSEPLNGQFSHGTREEACGILRNCTELQKLDNTWYTVSGHERAALTRTRRIFNEMMQDVSLPQLNRIELSGLAVSESALTTLFSGCVRIKCMRLNHIHLDGCFRNVFECIATKLEDLDELTLGDLFEHKRIEFVALKSPSQCPSGDTFVTSITRFGRDARNLVAYRVRLAKGKACSVHPHATGGDRLVYGPP